MVRSRGKINKYVPACVAGLVAVALALPVLACGAGLTGQERDTVIARICLLLERNYVFPDTGQNVSARLRAEHAQGRYAAAGSV